MLEFTSAVVVHQHKLCSPNQNKIHGVGGFWLYPQGHVCDLLYDCHDLLCACEKNAALWQKVRPLLLTPILFRDMAW